MCLNIADTALLARIPQLLELAPFFEQRLRLTDLDDASVVQYDNTVKVSDSIQTMRNGDDGVLSKLFVDDLPDHSLGVGIHAEHEPSVSSLVHRLGVARGGFIPARSLVQEDHAPNITTQKGTREKEKLPLSVA